MTGTMTHPIAAVMGWPIAHSLSPRLHTAWLAHYGISGSYIPLAVAPEYLEQAVKALIPMGFQGCNVTVPHKTAVIPFLDDLTARASKIGAVNLIIVKNGRLIGDNTDGLGFAADVAPHLHMAPKKITILGAGGAAQAIFHACLAYPELEQLNLANRSIDKAEMLAEGNEKVQIYQWNDLTNICDDVDILVNTTTMGMTGHESADWPPSDLQLDRLSPSALVYDIIYAPFETPLMKAARLQGRQAQNGLGMLIEQARPSFEAFFGLMPDRLKGIEDELKASLGA